MGSMGRMRKITLWSTASSVPGLCETKYTVPKEPLPSCFWTWRQLCPGNVSRGPFSFRFKILQWKHQGKINGYMLHHVTSYHILPNKRLAATQLALICCDVLDHEWRPVPHCPIAPVLKLKPRRLRETSETFWLHLTRFKDLRGVWYVGRCWYISQFSKWKESTSLRQALLRICLNEILPPSLVAFLPIMHLVDMPGMESWC